MMTITSNKSTECICPGAGDWMLVTHYLFFTKLVQIVFSIHCLLLALLLYLILRMWAVVMITLQRINMNW